jgi:hypothetical protein
VVKLEELWETIDFTTLNEAKNDNLQNFVKCLPGVYIWRRKFSGPSGGANNIDVFTNWVKDLTSQPVAIMHKTQLNHCLFVEGVQVGGGGLTPKKEETLSGINSPGIRKFVIDFVQSLSIFTAPIWIGQTSNLCQRVKQHLDGTTELISYVKTLGIDLSDLQFHYLPISSENKLISSDFIELLEMMSQRILAPFGTQRPG